MSAALGQASPGPRRRAAIVLAVVAVGVAIALAADALAGPGNEDAASRVRSPVPDAGTWYCPATADEGESATVSAAAVGDEASTITVVRYRDGRSHPDEPVDVAPGDQLEVSLDGDAARSPVSVRWEGGPAVASWRVEDESAGGATCVSTPSETWHVGGFDTAGDSSSTLHLFNPFTVDAVVRVTFATPEGPVSLLRTDDVVVESGSSQQLDLGEFQPEQPDLGVTVEVLTGRLVAQGELTLQDGEERALIPATPEASLEWAVPYARVDGASSSWLSVVNPGEREAAVELVVSQPRSDGPIGSEMSVPAGGVRRIDLAEFSEAREFGVAVRSVNGVDVAVSRLTSLGTAHGRRGLAASATTRAAERQALAGGGAGDRQGLISVYNPGAEEVDVDFNAGGATPSDWSGITLPPNGWTSVALHDAGPERPSIPVVVEATGPVVAGLRSHSSSGGLRLWSDAGAPSAAWTGRDTRPRVRRDPTLSTTPATTGQPAEETEPAEIEPDDLEIPGPEAEGE